ncbi:MAG: bifunctional DNA primase/polymerase [Burkholderiales bacterium]|nr:bifunctional DNA primase/polymerase [Burkholderiales bacterium]
MMLLTDQANLLLDAALRYAQMGWPVFPIQPAGKQPFPSFAGGFHGARTDADIITRWWAQWPHANIGMPVAPLGIFVVDIDPRNGGDSTLEILEAKHGKLPDTLMQRTGGGGLHYLYRRQTGAHLKAKLGPGIDVKTDGYIAVSPSVTQRTYEWLDCDWPDASLISEPPAWLIAELIESSPSISAGAATLSADQVCELRSALACIPADNYHQWLECGMACHATGAGEQAYGIWTEWSQQSAKFDPRVQRKKWASFSVDRNDRVTVRTIFAKAQAAGWLNPMSNTARLAPVNVTTTPSIQPQLVDPFPEHLLWPPGLIGDIVRYMNATAIRPQPVLELAAAIAFCGTIMGRKVCTPTDLRTNVYVIGVADSGAGKEHARRAMLSILEGADALSLLGGERLASDAGLFSALHASPSSILLLDEVGRFLRTVTAPRAPAYLVNLATMLMELTSAANRIFLEKRRAEHAKEKLKLIHQPNVCMYGTTVPGRLFQAITRVDVEDGFFPRLLIFPCDTPAPVPQRPADRTVPAKLIETVKAWMDRPVNAAPSGNLDALIPKPQVVPINTRAQQCFDDLQADADRRRLQYRGTGLDAMWSRCHEHALRLALIRAAGIEFEAPVITEPDAIWAIELAQYLVGCSVQEIENQVAENLHEHAVKKVATFIRIKGRVSMTELARSFRWLKGRERDDVLGILREAGQAEIEREATEGRSRIWITWTERREESGKKVDLTH